MCVYLCIFLITLVIFCVIIYSFFVSSRHDSTISLMSLSWRWWWGWCWWWWWWFLLLLLILFSGRWFGTFCCFHILGRIIPVDFHIFQRGWYTTHHLWLLFSFTMSWPGTCVMGHLDPLRFCQKNGEVCASFGRIFVGKAATSLCRFESFWIYPSYVSWFLTPSPWI